MRHKKSSPPLDIPTLLKSVRVEVNEKARCQPRKEGLFKAVLKASFVRLHEYAEFVHSTLSGEGPGSFFGSASLRQCCEDLIALKFLALLKRKDRDAVIQALMIISTGKASEKQSAFFKLNHPYQPILPATIFSPERINEAKQLLTEVGSRTQLWNTRSKLPPVEQMAQKVGLSELYEYLYAATSEVVHFNVRIALRSGWGDGDEEFNFSPSNFSQFYAQFAKTYSAYLWFSYCRVFRTALGLSQEFMNAVDSVELAVQSVLRWPELVTFEEMNVPQNNNLILRAFLAVKQEERIEKLRSKHAKKISKGARKTAVLGLSDDS